MGIRQDIRELGAELVVFFNAEIDLVSRWFEHADLPRDLIVAADPDASLYEQLGAPHVSFLRLLKGTPRAALRAHRAGFRIRLTRADMQRLGADVVVDGKGEIARLHRADNPDDRLAPEAVLRELAALQAA